MKCPTSICNPFLRKNPIIFFAILLLNIFSPSVAKSSPKDKSGHQEVLAMIELIMPGKSAFFKLEELPRNGGKDSFFLEILNVGFNEYK